MQNLSCNLHEKIIIFISITLHLASLWNRGSRQLGNGRGCLGVRCFLFPPACAPLGRRSRSCVLELPPFLPLFMRLPSGLEPDVFWKPRAQANKSLQERVFFYVFALPFSSNSNYLAAKNFQFSSNFPANITLYCENRATFSWLANWSKVDDAKATSSLSFSSWIEKRGE